MVASTSTAQKVFVPRTQKGKRVLQARAPKLVENSKQALFVRGAKTNDTVNKALRDLCRLRKPHAHMMNRKNPVYPFEDDTFFEKHGAKFDASLFAFGNNSKKRPNNLILGRMYDFHVLDMFEFGIENFVSMEAFKAQSVPVSCKPCITFAGAPFQSDPTFARLKNFLIDFFRLENAENINLPGVQLAICFTATDTERVHMRVYRIHLKKSGTSTPRAELTEIGPRMDLKPRREVMASDDLFKLANKQPKQNKVRKVKNMSKDVFGSQLGRVHVGKQDLKRLQTRKMKGLKKQPKSDKKPAAAAVEKQ